MEQRWLQHAVKELKALKSFKDFKVLNDKLLFLLLRKKGDFIKGTQVPYSLQMEPTNVCNLRCSCCSGHLNERKRGFMDFALFSQIIDEAADVGVKRIHLYLHGEPLLHKQIGPMAHYIKSKNLSLTMATNAMLLSGKKMAEIMEAGMTSADYLLLSVLGYSKEAHEAVMRGVDHEKVVENIRGLVEYRKTRKLKGPIIETVFYTMPENVAEEQQYCQYWGAIVDNARVAGYSEQYRTYKNGASQMPMRTHTCKHIWERMAIQWNGDVVLCHADINGKNRLGNLEYNSIRELWNGKQITFIRSMHRARNFNGLSICGRCDW